MSIIDLLIAPVTKENIVNKTSEKVKYSFCKQTFAKFKKKKKL